MSDLADPRVTLAAEMELLRVRYLERLNGDLAEVAQLAAGLSGGERDRQALGKLHHRLHKLAGSAGTFGFEVIGGRVRQLEAIAQEWLESSLDEIDRAALRFFIDDVKGLRAE